MSAVFGRRGPLVALVAWSLVVAAVLAPLSARADSISVNIDEAHVMKLPDRVATIVIGNPLIADASLQSGGLLVITGKSYGATNMVVLDRAGKKLTDMTIQVVGPTGSDLVIVYKGVDRESYSCNPNCERRLSISDATPYFSAIMNQAGARTSGAQPQASGSH